jgi:serine phosphatase RsbU (regulator of sigma subunit)
MTPTPHTIGPDANWEEAAGLLERWRIRHLPVIDQGLIVGIVSARQLIGWRAEHLDRLVVQRTNELQQVNAQLVARDAELRRNMALAGRLQARLLLPAAPPTWPGLRWALHYQPLDPLGGDYYDFAQPDDRHIGVLVADASGHSIPAALVAIMARLAFSEVAPTTTAPSAVLTAMNRRLQGLTDERFVTAFYGVLDRTTRQFTFANAGHPPPVHWSARTGEAQPLAARGFMLGILPEPHYVEGQIPLEAGDKLCLLTDGVTECRNPAGDPFGTERVADLLSATPLATPADFVGQLVQQLTDFRGGHTASDDVTVLLTTVV